MTTKKPETEFLIRKAVPEDAEGILQAHVASIRIVAAKDYIPEQIHGWSTHLTPEGYRRAMTAGGETMFVAELDGTVVGFAAIKQDEVKAVYVAPEAIGKGVGRALYEAVEGVARANGVSSLRLSSSITAEGFYQAMGFTSCENTSHRLSSGTRIACIRMEKPLTQEAQ